MDPLEQIWRNEVVYLHSLWRQGPPNQPKPNPNPRPSNLPPSNLTAFKKKKKKKRERRGSKNRKELVVEKPGSDAEWPIQPVVEPCGETGWPESSTRRVVTTRPASLEEQSRLAAVQLQQKGLKACQDYFLSKAGSDSEGGDGEGDDFVDEDEEEEEEFEFFWGIFKEDCDLRSYYEKNFEAGDFCCLVCGGIGKKVGKRFKNCVALVQHSISISKTKQKMAHRAFGRVICRVLGWDINGLPSIVRSLDKPLGSSLSDAEPHVGQRANGDGEKKDDTENGIIDEQKGDIENTVNCDAEKNEDLQDTGVDSSDVASGESGQKNLFEKHDEQGKRVDTVKIDTGELMDFKDVSKEYDRECVDGRNSETMECTVLDAGNFKGN